jgi:hypothetical protein
VEAIKLVEMYAGLVTLEEMGEKVAADADVHLNFALVPGCRYRMVLELPLMVAGVLTTVLILAGALAMSTGGCAGAELLKKTYTDCVTPLNGTV